MNYALWVKTVPGNSVIEGYTYKHVKQDGSPDKTVADNPQMPIAVYGEIVIKSLNLTYFISKEEAEKQFVETFKVLKTKTSNAVID